MTAGLPYRRDDAPGRRPSARTEFILVTAVYGLLTLALTYPAVLHLGTRFMGDGGDGHQNVWNLWWIKKALLEEHTTVYFTEYLYHPTGTSLLFQTLNPFNGLISIPLQLVFGMEAVYNLIVLFSFAASGVGTYYLVRYLTGSRAAALISGIVFAFCPYHFAHGLGHLQLIAMEWLPVYTLFILRTLDEGGWRNAVLAGFFLVLTALCSWYYLIYALMLTLLLMLARIGPLWRNRGRWKHLALAFATFGFVLGPLLVTMIHAKLTQTFTGAHDPEVFSADLTSFFVPSGISTYGGLTESIWSTWSGNTAENANYLGYVVLAVAIYALVRVGRSRIWGIAAATSLVLAMGPYPRFMGTQVRIPMPYLFLHDHVPLMDFTGVPERFTILAVLCLAVLCGYGIAHWLSRTALPSSTARTAIGGIGLLIVLEYLAVPFPMVQVEVPAFYYEMGQDDATYGVIDVPRTNETIYYATIHGKPLVEGYVSRPSTSATLFLQQTPIVSSLIYHHALPRDVDVAELGRQVFARHDIRYIVSHDHVHTNFVHRYLGLPVVDEGGGITVFDCRGP